MIQRIQILIRYFLFWLLLFFVFRVVFILLNFHQFETVRLTDIGQVFIRALKLDFSLAAYLLAFPAIYFTFFAWLPAKIDRTILKYYTLVMLGLVSLLNIINLGLYKFWHYHIDISLFDYINTPADMLASLSWYHYVILLLGLAASYLLFYKLIYKRFIRIETIDNPKPVLAMSLVFLFLTGCLVFPMRGGLKTAPLNTGVVYFHSNIIVNHAAVNPVWNFIYSLTESDELRYQADFYDSDEAEKIVQSIRPKSVEPIAILNTKNPNIVLIILESFSSAIIQKSGGKSGVTPNFERLIPEGVFFNQLYATGTTSPAGIGAIISGYPSLPISNILKFDDKSENLPGMGKAMAKKGYTNCFYYGGDIDFGHLNSYLVSAHFQKIISQSDFPAHQRTSSWGVPDEIVFDRLLEETNAAKEPFFNAFFTLSSHEPYDVPAETVFPGASCTDKFYNAAHYTDACLGKFIEEAKKQHWWENTLVILVADHGARIGDMPLCDKNRFHIPMLWLGGALNKTDTIIDRLANQTDIPATILSQMDLDVSDFTFSRNLLADDPHPYATFSSHYTIAYLDNNQSFTYDLTSDRFHVEETLVENPDTMKLKAILQYMVADFKMR